MTRRPPLLPALEIRNAHAAGATDAELVARYNADLSTISKILRGLVQRDAGGPIVKARRGGRRKGTGRRIYVRLPTPVLQAIDRVRGDEPRGDWIAKAAEERLGRLGGETI